MLNRHNLLYWFVIRNKISINRRVDTPKKNHHFTVKKSPVRLRPEYYLMLSVNIHTNMEQFPLIYVQLKIRLKYSSVNSSATISLYISLEIFFRKKCYSIVIVKKPFKLFTAYVIYTISTNLKQLKVYFICLK